MDIDKFFVSILFVILPGIVAVKIFWSLTGNRNQKDWHEYLDIFLFSLICYGLYGLGQSLLNWGQNYQGLELFDLLLDQKTTSNYWAEITWVCVIAVPVAFTASYIYTYKLLNRVGQKIRATYRYGDADVWDFFHNTGKIEWVFVRDHKLNLTYKCWINTYSDSEKNRELILKDVSVYSSLTSDYLYDVPTMYLARNQDDLSIEIIPREGGN